MLREQILDANDSIVANLAEGFEQSTDRAFANFVYLLEGFDRRNDCRGFGRLNSGNSITAAELEFHLLLGDEVRRLLAGLARYLAKSDYKERGRFKSGSEDATQDQGLRTKDRGATTEDQRPGTEDPGPATKDEGPGTKDERLGTKD